MNHQALSSFIWSVADPLRRDYKQSEYGRAILPFTVLRRMDYALEPTKSAVLKQLQANIALSIYPEPFLLRAAQQSFYDINALESGKLIGDQDNSRPPPSAMSKTSRPRCMICSRMTMMKSGMLPASGSTRTLERLLTGRPATIRASAYRVKEKRLP